MLAGGHGEVGLPPLPLLQGSRRSAGLELELHSVPVKLAGLEQTSSPLWDPPTAWCSLTKCLSN